MPHVACQTTFRVKKKSNSMSDTDRIREKRRKNDVRHNDTLSMNPVVTNTPQTSQHASMGMMANVDYTSAPTSNETTAMTDVPPGSNQPVPATSLPHVNDIDLQHIMNNIYSGGAQVSSLNVMDDFVRQTLYDYHKMVSFVITQAIQDRRISIKNVLEFVEEQQSLQTTQLMFLTGIHNLQGKLDRFFNPSLHNESV